jgi:hypothetical protein
LGWIKFSTDASVDLSSREASLGMTARSNNDAVVFSAWKQIINFSDIDTAEALATEYQLADPVSVVAHQLTNFSRRNSLCFICS